jgi:hypothetical protein
MDKIENIIDPPLPILEPRITNNDILLGKPIPAIDHLKVLSADEFEKLILEWIHGYLKTIRGNVYKKIRRNAGAGDKGRDVIAIYEDDSWDNYQCKYYKDPLTPINIYIELGKLCYYTFIKDYTIPKKYYFVSPCGVGQTLFDYLNEPAVLKKQLIVNWDKYCKNYITKKKEISLVQRFKEYVDEFDFSIFSAVEPLEFLEQFRQTRYYAIRFGGGLTKMRPKDEIPPEEIGVSELVYTEQILNAYSDHKKEKINDIEDLETYPEFKNHFQRQREYFYCADSLYQFSRDALPIESNCFDDLKNEIYEGIIEIIEANHSDGLEKLNQTIHESVKISLTSSPLQSNIYAKDKKGICHHLVNESRIKWVKD